MSEQNSARGAMTFFRLARVDKNQNLTNENDNVFVRYVGQFVQGGKNGRLMFFFKSRASVLLNLMR